jgi:predicted dithiol-disulfide oxidoreductase (DUF899 family)
MVTPKKTPLKVGTREEWLKARMKLLKVEKELTRQSDKVAQERQALPWVPIEKKYQFDTEAGKASLGDLFQGRSQLLVYHFMFGPDYKAGCPACSSIADGFNGFAVHLANHDVTLMAISRAPFAKLQAYKKRLGWTFPWASSFGSDFNYDFGVGFTEEQQRQGDVNYNYIQSGIKSRIHKADAREKASEGGSKVAATTGTDWATYSREAPGMSAFALADGKIYHTYSAFARGLDAMWGLYQWLDRAPKGRNETEFWFRRRDEYDRNKG